MSLLHLLVCAFLINFCTSVHVYTEEGKIKTYKRFPLPVMNGFTMNTETNIDVLEVRNFEENEEKNIKLITNFPNLKYINISYVGIKKMPKFLNIPNAEWMVFNANKLTKLPSNAISSLPLIEIGFSGNLISEIGDNAIGDKVTDINLDCNQLTELSPTWFKNPGLLKILGLRHNQILTINENLTHHFTSLQYLDLSYNKIVSIGNGAFSALSTMGSLNLQANHLSVLQPEIFGSSINITESFNIGRNYLNYLSKNFLKKLAVKKFVILGNPWQCPCLREIEIWMALNVNDKTYDTYLLRWKKTNPVCVVASSFSNQCVELVDDEMSKMYVENLLIVDEDVCKNI